MKKVFFLLCFSIFCKINYTDAQNPQLSDIIRLEEPPRSTGDSRCASVFITFKTPYIRTDCPDIPQTQVDVSYRLFDCFSALENNFCDISHVEIAVNGIPIKTINSNDINNMFNNESISSNEYLHLIDANLNVACFSTKVFKTCTLTGVSEIFSTERCIPIVKEGDEFSVVRYGGPITSKELECLDYPQIVVCCNEDTEVTITTTISASESSSQSNTIDISFGNFSIDAGLGDVDFPITFNEITTGTLENNQSISATKTIKIIREDGVCNSAAIVLNFKTKYIDKYTIGGCVEGYEPESTIQDGKQLFSVGLARCQFDGCNQNGPQLVLSRGKDKSLIRRFDSCTGSILADVPSTYEGELVFNWSGPNGFTSNLQNLENVLMGNYTLIVSDACCNEFEFSYFLCDNIIKGEWEKDEENLVFCRSLFCDSEDCEIENSVECVEPDEIIEVFENESCIEKYYFEGEFLSQVSSVAIINIDYNESSNQCIKIAKCANQGFIVDTGSPTYGNWDFNYASEECVRSIICFNQEVINTLDKKEPVINETFNLVTGLCDRVAYCNDGQPIILSPKAPIASLPWQWTELQGCTKNVQCSSDSGFDNVSGNEGFTNWDFNSFTNMCESDVTCQGTPMAGVTHSEFPNSVGIWQWSSARPFNEQCYRSILCGTNWIEDTSQPTFQQTGIPCGGNTTQSYVICNGTNTFEIVCSFKSEEDDSETRSIYIREEKNDIDVFPNPFTNIVNIKGLNDNNSYVADFINITGQLIFQQEIQNGEIELDHLPDGFYILKIKQGNQIVTTKKVYKQQ